MAEKEPKQVAKIEIICTDDELANVVIEGDKNVLIATLASLIADESDDNEFNNLLHVAMTVALYAKKQKPEKKTRKKKSDAKPTV